MSLFNTKKEKGQKGEDLASQYLTENGYKIIEKNWKCRWGEVDLIAQKGPKLTFVEVKARKGKSYGSPLEAVHKLKQEKIVRTALLFIQKNPHYEEFTFAVIGVDLEKSSKSVEFIEFPLDGFDRYY